MRSGYTCIMSSKNRTVIYVGGTNDLYTRVIQHRSGKGSCFTSKYNCFDLIYYEVHSRITDATDREKQLKRWRKEWKWNLIRGNNPSLTDLFDEL
ncbi:MAG: GIY-YIG nuclease family protein [Bacteroidota bacterium]